MLDEMSLNDFSQIDGTDCIIDLSYLAEEFKNVDFVICMNPHLYNNQKFKIKPTLKGKHRNKACVLTIQE